MKHKGRVLEVPIRDREFESLLRRASEITIAQRPPLKARALPRKAPVSIAR
jgi:hypothetical protein